VCGGLVYISSDKATGWRLKTRGSIPDNCGTGDKSLSEHFAVPQYYSTNAPYSFNWSTYRRYIILAINNIIK